MNNLNEIRQKIDAIDEKILALLAERRSFMRDVAKYKKAHNMPLHQPEREAEILRAKKELATNHGLSHELVEKIFLEIFADSKALQAAVLESEK